MRRTAKLGVPVIYNKWARCPLFAAACVQRALRECPAGIPGFSAQDTKPAGRYDGGQRGDRIITGFSWLINTAEIQDPAAWDCRAKLMEAGDQLTGFTPPLLEGQLVAFERRRLLDEDSPVAGLAGRAWTGAEPPGTGIVARTCNTPGLIAAERPVVQHNGSDPPAGMDRDEPQA